MPLRTYRIRRQRHPTDKAMKSHQPTAHRSRRKRRAHDEAALPAGAREVAQSPAQSLDTLRDPQASHRARGAAALGLQRAVGNAQVARELGDRATVQRDDAPAPTADPAKAEQERRDKQAADSQ